MEGGRLNLEPIKLGGCFKDLIRSDWTLWTLGFPELEEQLQDAYSFYVFMNIHAKLTDPLRAQLEPLQGGAWAR